MRAIFNPGGAAPQRIVGTSRRVPMPTSRSVSRPKFIAGGNGQPQRMPIIDDAATVAERHDRRADTFRQRANRVSRVQRATAHP